MWLKAARLPQFALSSRENNFINKTSQKMNSAWIMKKQYAASTSRERFFLL